METTKPKTKVVLGIALPDHTWIRYSTVIDYSTDCICPETFEVMEEEAIDKWSAEREAKGLSREVAFYSLMDHKRCK